MKLLLIFSCHETFSQLINSPQTGNVMLIGAAGSQLVLWWSEQLSVSVFVCAVCVCVGEPPRRQGGGRLKVMSDERFQKLGNLIVADAEHLSSHPCAGSPWPIYVVPAESKHCSTQFKQTLLSWETQTRVIPSLCVPSCCLPATCANKWCFNIC